MTFVVSLGGSIVAPPEGPDISFLVEFKKRLASWLAAADDRKLILVIGGGGPARVYQHAYREIVRRLAPSPGAIDQGGPASNEALDWIGIAATRLNAQLVQSVMGDLCEDEVVTDPSGPIVFAGKVLIASGWKPGFSTDFDAVYLGERFGARSVLNLSNIAKVYTADPKKDPGARPIDAISWPDFRAMVGTAWSPGANLPFDPIASARAEAAGISVICAAGKDVDNLFRILDGKTFTGTVIG